jgi:peptide/nickel transport system permease protein
MLNYLLRRLLYSILILWGVATVIFLLFIVLPGRPLQRSPGKSAEPQSVNARHTGLGSGERMDRRYGLYLNDLSPIGVTSARKKSEAPTGVHLTRLTDSNYLSLKAPYLGRSVLSGRSVAVVLGQALPGTILLAFAALILACVLGIALGVIAVVKKDTIWDTSAITASVASMSMPAFFAALFIAYISGYLLVGHAGLNLTGRMYEHEAIVGRSLTLHNLVLPAIALAIRPMAIITQLTRNALLDVLSQDYIRTAYAKGLSKTRVVLRHALPNALFPLAAVSSAWPAELLAASFFVEYIFGWKGIGKVTIDALEKYDLPVIMGAALLTALIFIIVNLLTGLLRRLFDPRLRLS